MSIIKKRCSPLAFERKRDKRKAVSGGTGREGCGSTHSDRLNSRAPGLFFFCLPPFPFFDGLRRPRPTDLCHLLSILFLFISLLPLPLTLPLLLILLLILLSFSLIPSFYPFLSFSIFLPPPPLIPTTRLPPIIISILRGGNGLAPIYFSSCLKKKMEKELGNIISEIDCDVKNRWNRRGVWWGDSRDNWGKRDFDECHKEKERGWIEESLDHLMRYELTLNFHDSALRYRDFTLFGIPCSTYGSREIITSVGVKIFIFLEHTVFSLTISFKLVTWRHNRVF